MINSDHIILSICIPTFNRSESLLSNLIQICEQITPDIEIIVSDNHSDDNTADILDKFINENNLKDYIRVFRQKENVGFDKNLLTVVEHARGKYCWLLGDDDYIKQGGLAAIIKLIKDKKPSFVLVNYSTLNKQNILASTPMICSHNDIEFKNAEDFFFYKTRKSYFYSLGLNMLFMSACIVNKNFWLKSLKKIEKYVGSHCIHVFAIIQLIIENPHIYFVSEPLIYGTASSRKQGWGGRLFWLSFMDSLCKYLEFHRFSSAKISQLKKNPVRGITWKQKSFHFFAKIPGGTFWQKFIILALDKFQL